MHCTAVDIGYMMVTTTIVGKVQYICGSYDGSLIEEGTLHAGDLWARIHGYYLVMSLPDIPMYNVPANFVSFESFSSIDSLNYKS